MNKTLSILLALTMFGLVACGGSEETTATEGDTTAGSEEAVDPATADPAATDPAATDPAAEGTEGTTEGEESGDSL